MEKSIEVEGIKMHYNDTGEGDRAVVLMHGWGCNSTTVAMIERIASETHRVLNVDFPGFGNSQEPQAIWGVEEYTRAIEALVQSEGLKDVTLIGHSFGGRVGILYSSRNKVSKLILVDAAGIKPRRSLKYYFKVYSFKAAKRLTTLFCSKEKAQKKIDAMRAKRGSQDYASSTPMMRSILSKIVNEDLRDKLPLIKAPTLLIWGENDTATPLRDARIMEKMIPDAGLVSFPGCGHYSFLDNPGQFTAVLRSFLSSGN